jgi:hypothetical protein
MSKEITLTLDDKSVEILDKLDALHRATFINYCIRVGTKTDLFGVLLGEKEIENILPEICNINTTKEEVKAEEPTKDFSINW